MMKTSSKAILVLALLTPACGGGGGTGESTTPEGGASYEGPVASSNVEHGHLEWNEHCAGCHTESAGSYGPRVASLAWTPAHMRRQIREGEGRMPGFDASQLSAEDLEDTLAYLVSIGAVAQADASAPATP